MTNTELTLDQLTAIAGGVKEGPDGRTCTDPPFRPGTLDKELKKRIMKQSKGGVYSPPEQGGNQNPTVNH